MNLLRQCLKWTLTSCLPERRWLVRGRRARGVHGPAISLTFDDGPHPEFTPLILDRLQTFGWKGTFFVIGERAEEYPEIIRRIVQEGHEIGTHSWSHSDPRTTSAAKLFDETLACERLLTELCGVNVSTLRPPKGELSWQKILEFWRRRRTVVLWNVDPKDYRPAAGLDLRRWAACYAPQNGDIVLLHDGYPQAMELLDQLQEHRRLVGVETVTISNWLPERSNTADGEKTLQTQGKSKELRCL